MTKELDHINRAQDAKSAEVKLDPIVESTLPVHGCPICEKNKRAKKTVPVICSPLVTGFGPIFELIHNTIRKHSNGGKPRQ